MHGDTVTPQYFYFLLAQNYLWENIAQWLRAWALAQATWVQIMSPSLNMCDFGHVTSSLFSSYFPSIKPA